MLQTSSLRSIPAEFWAATAAFLTGGVFVAKKLLARRQKPKPEYINRAEFHAAMDATRDRIGACYLALADKIDSNHRDLLAAIDRQGANFENRLDHLETTVARLDERTHTALSH